jgi:hypothetical protein
MLEVHLFPPEVEQGTHASARRDREDDEQSDVRRIDVPQQLLDVIFREVTVSRRTAGW